MSCFDYFTQINCIELAHYLKSILLVLFPIIGLFLAYKGLQTWYTQLKGTDKYQHAKSVVIRIYEIQELIKSINPSFLEKGGRTQEGSKEYFNHLENVQNKLIEKKAEISLSLMILKAIDNFDSPIELTDLTDYIKKFYEYIPYIALKEADHQKLSDGYSFLYETDYKDLDEAVNKAIKPFQAILIK